MAESIVESAAQNIGRLLVEEGRFLYAVGDKIKKLEEELEWMQLFLQDAEAKQHDQAVVRKWISKIKDFAYEAEDILENYILKISYKRQDGFWNALKWFPRMLRDAIALHQVGSDIDDLTQKISSLTSRMTTYGLHMRDGGSSSSLARQMEYNAAGSSSHAEEDVIVGLGNDSAKLADQLVHPEYKIVVITGMGGLGKTTLARKVYRHPTVRQHFQAFSWVHVSQQFQTNSVLKEILLGLTPLTQRNGIEALSEAEIPDKVCEKLKEKPCFVVLDDIWNFEDWNRLHLPFLRDDCCSKLLLTTRTDFILQELNHPGISYHEPTKLTEEQSWELLRKTAIDRMDGAETRG